MTELIDVEKELFNYLDEEVGLAFAKEYNFTEKDIQKAREYNKKHPNFSFTTSIIDLHIINKMCKENK